MLLHNVTAVVIAMGGGGGGSGGGNGAGGGGRREEQETPETRKAGKAVRYEIKQDKPDGEAGTASRKHRGPEKP